MKHFGLLLCFALLLLCAPSAHAFAIYNHVGHEVCVSTKPIMPVIVGPAGIIDMTKWCDLTVPANGTYNGKSGSGMDDIYFAYNTKSGGKCKLHKTVFTVDIPNGGFARVYDHSVSIFKHCNKCEDSDRVGTVRFSESDCD